MELADVQGKTCVVGLSYFDSNGDLLRQAQLAGTVQKINAEMGITLTLQHADPNVPAAEFILPPDLQAWFKAPPGHYRHAPSGVDIQNPDFLVTWDIHRKRNTTAEGQHEWWDWVPNTTPPQVGS